MKIDYVVTLAMQIFPDLAESDELFDEVTQLNSILKEIPNELFSELSAEEKWNRVFREANSLKILYRIISAILSVY